MMQHLHDYVKENYERGNFQTYNEPDWSKTEHSYKNCSYQQNTSDDYQLGYQQARRDYETQHAFRHYPEELVKLTNKLVNGRVSEILEYIKGYNAGKEELLHK
ncbi:hypothetical protein FC19_GL000123 [Liquorilactobacillus aquaticus DSM 21051]|uniref:Uncharacterized protein n=1 Tax=Liquorilactobacillus aquaticus DSM 21051 TaxID=1423725 RepID=A0A0R2CTZ2_9LACO|nr:hypothetical protein [Liquorilactobacillus aquaticus]KRM94864.1 hypothetical protein FC19_GL000123 [Liquorilactobacillus aquaticus DSM 21051]